MTYSHAFTRTAQFAGAAVLTTAIAATAVGPTAQGLENHNLKAAYQSVSVPLLALTAVESNIELAASTSTVALLSPSAGAQAAATAKDTASDFLYSVVRAVAGAASFLALPLWWIAFPVTFPLGYIYAQSRMTPPTGCFGYGALFCGLSNANILLQALFLGPVYIVGNLLPPITAPAAATTTSTVAARRQTAAVNTAPREARIDLRNNASRQTSVNSASTKSRGAAKSPLSDSKSERASAASKRRSAG